MVEPKPANSGVEERMIELQKQLADLKRRFPAHSLSPALLQQLDELEEALSKLQAQQTALTEGENLPEGKA